MTTDVFLDHTLDSAPPGSRRLMESTVRKLGVLTPAVARLAESPHTLEGVLKASALFETTTLAPIAREVLIMTIADEKRLPRLYRHAQCSVGGTRSVC